MLNVINVVHKLIWIATDSLKLKIHFILNYAFGVVQGVLMFFTPFALSEMVKSISGADNQKLLYWFWMLVAMSLGFVLSKYISRFFFEYLARIIPIKLKEKYYEKVYQQSYTWHTNNSIGYFLSVIDDVAKIMRTWLWAMNFSYIPSLIFTVVFFIYTYIKSPYLFLYLFVGMSVFVVLTRLFYTKRIYYTHNATQSDNNFNKIYTDFTYNVRSVKKMNLIHFVMNTLGRFSSESFKNNKKLMRYNANQWGFTELFLSGLFLIPTGFFIYQYLTTGQNIDLVVMIVAVQGNIQNIGREFMHLMTELASNKTQIDILEKHLQDLQITTNTNRNIHIKKWNKIVFDNMMFQFKYDNTKFKSFIKHIEINRGDHIAIVGASGTGKSTFLNLLTRQLEPLSGSIKIDNVDYKNVADDFFNKNLTYISQDVELFDLSLYENITLGHEIRKQELNKILSGCCLNDLIHKNNNDLNLQIGEKGIKISGGERQRINLARGLILNREILVLDEITANLDPKTTKKIWEFIFKEYKNKTIIAISHTPELLNHVNKVIEFNNGCGTIKEK